MTTFDYIVLVIVGLSVLLSIMRGFVRETLALAGWIAACLVAKAYTLNLAQLLPSSIPTDSLRLLAAFLVLFLTTLLAFTLLAIAITHIFKKTGLGWMDRILGGAFGLVRGVIIVTILVFLAGLTTLPKDARWRSAMFSAPFEAIVVSLMPWIPRDIAKYVKYD